MTRIVVADDNPVLRELLVTVLEEKGYVVQAASDGSTALTVLASFAPDLLITDVQMPTMSGWELLAAARAVSRPFPSSSSVRRRCSRLAALTSHATPAS